MTVQPGTASAALGEPAPEFAPAQPVDPLRRRLARGAMLEVVGFGSGQILRLASNLILTRLLLPQAFGLMAMLSLVMYGLMMLSDVGLAQAVIRSPRGEDPVFLDTTWSIKALRGLGLWILAALLAWPASILFREKTLLLLIPIGSASAFLQGLYSMRVLLLRRQLRLFPLVSVDLSTQIVGLFASIGLAYAGWGVWALVIGTLVGTATHSILTFTLPGTYRERFRIDPDCRHEITHFGRWIFASSAVTFAAGRGDQAILGRLLGAAGLGIYNVALGFADLPDALVGRLIDGVLFPLYGRIHNERPADFERVYYWTRLLLDSVAHTALGGLLALAPWIIHLLYNDRYHGAAPMLQILVLRTSLTILAAPCETALVAQGHSIFGFRRNVAVAAATVVAMPLGHVIAGVHGLVWGSAVSRLAALGALWPAARRCSMFKLHRELLFIPFLGLGYTLGRLFLLALPRV